MKKRQELDQAKKELCEASQVRLIEWPYSLAPTAENVEMMIGTDTGGSKIRKVIRT